MRRAERLFEIVQLIRGRRLSTAQFLAEHLQVSARTVYRDVADLQAQGVPIEGEAGVGYRMRAGFDLPPLMFTNAEAQALVAAVRIAQPRLDAALASQAEAALSKILAILPTAARAAAESLAIYAPAVEFDPATRERLELLRIAAEQRRKVHIAYLDQREQRSERTLRPLGCFYWGAVWTDRKFLAAAGAHPERPNVWQATDCRWLDWWKPLKAAGVTVEFLCPADACMFYKKKFPDRDIPPLP